MPVLVGVAPVAMEVWLAALDGFASGTVRAVRDQRHP